MKPTRIVNQGWKEGISRLGTDPLTTLLVGLALFLTAAITALGVDLWQWPENESEVLALAAQEPAGWTAAPPVGLMPDPTPTWIPAPAAVRLRIPTLDIDRSIIEVPLTYDSPSNSWKRDLELLFPQGRQDLVGHYVGSASPGQAGNTILVGHNYGHGTKGVFVRLEQLEVGQQVEVVNEIGQTFIYQVTQVTRVPWSEQNQQELLEHQTYLSAEGPERLTLVTCGGSIWKPFPLRVYVVADPAR